MIPDNAIKRIQNYSYQSVDGSIVDRYIRKLCTLILTLIPLTLSPNIITLFGTSLVIMSSIVLHLYTSVYTVLLCALCLFLYQLADVLDGMQGRRVNMYTNPTTEIFDHGCDSITTSLTTMNVCTAVGVTSPFVRLLFFLLPATMFYLPTWEHVHTKVMQFRAGPGNPTEALLLVEAFYVLSTCVPFMKTPVFHYMTLCTLLLTCAYNSYQSLRAVFTTKFGMNLEVMKTLSPLLLIWLLGVHNLRYDVESNVWVLLVVWLVSIVELIWTEITWIPYNFYKIVIMIVLAVYLQGLSLVITIPCYIYTFTKYVEIMCSHLNMKHFWSIPPPPKTIHSE